MRLSRPTFSSALASCCIHSVALGFAATLIVAAPQEAARPLKVTLLQRPMPLPVGEGRAAEKSAVIPSEKPPVPSPVPQVQPKPKPVAQSRRPRSVPPKIVKTPPLLPSPQTPPPSIVQPAEPQEPLMQVAAISPDATTSVGADGVSPFFSGAATEGHGEPTNAGKAHDVTKPGGGQGGKAGAAAQPDYNVNPKPPYPMLARRLGAQGVVLLRVQVRMDGTVATVELARSSGFSMLDDSATRTVRESWRFVPARMDGAPIVSWVEVPIRFVLEDS